MFVPKHSHQNMFKTLLLCQTSLAVSVMNLFLQNSFLCMFRQWKRDVRFYCVDNLVSYAYLPKENEDYAKTNTDPEVLSWVPCEIPKTLTKISLGANRHMPVWSARNQPRHSRLPAKALSVRLWALQKLDINSKAHNSLSLKALSVSDLTRLCYSTTGLNHAKNLIRLQWKFYKGPSSS